MQMNYSVIGKVRNCDNINKLVEGIRAKGYSCYNFLDKDTVPEASHKTRQEQMDILESHSDFWNDPLHKDHFETDLEGLKNAETIIMLLPAGSATHIEAGVAFDLKKKLVLIGEPEKPETLYLIFDEHYPDIESFLRTI